MCPGVRKSDPKPDPRITSQTRRVQEKTPKYIEMHPASISRLAQTFPSMKFMLVLREPVARLYSWFNMVCLSSEQKNTTRAQFGAQGFADILDGLVTLSCSHAMCYYLCQ